MEIPKYLREVPNGINCYGIDIVRKCLEIEANMLRNEGRKDAATALASAAKALKKVVKSRVSPAEAFDWLEAPVTEGASRDV